MKIKDKILFFISLGSIIQLISCNSIKTIKPQIVKYEFHQLSKFGYSFFYQLSDGHIRNETGLFDDKAGILRVTGIYSYIDEDQNKHLVRYSADENGFVTNDDTEDIEADISINQPMEISSAAVATLSG
ncbi:unnamed protein product [Chironomus riparius]|uniref:Uncharacterized protein n=1 Tax=Chironomus riparius TaxID=315576 RepID=A0A9N9RL34_9DIPT|nr:unnamed protein product [Chironomus riparius]